MTAEARQQIRERCDRAIETPYRLAGYLDARQDLRALLAEIERLEKDRMHWFGAYQELGAALADEREKSERLEKERDEAKMLLEHAVTVVAAPLDRMIVDFLAAPSSPGRERE